MIILELKWCIWYDQSIMSKSHWPHVIVLLLHLALTLAFFSLSVAAKANIYLWGDIAVFTGVEGTLSLISGLRGQGRASPHGDLVS